MTDSVRRQTERHNVSPLFCCVICCATLVVSVGADLFTSTAILQQLIQSEKEIPEIIDNYIELEERRLTSLKSLAEKHRERNADLQSNLESVTNPINAYRVITRLSNEWSEMQERMQETDHIKEFLEEVKLSGKRFPEKEDVSGAIKGILRLQDTYRLETSDIANGFIRGRNVTSRLSALDCFEIGRYAYSSEDYYHTLNWMQEAERRSINIDGSRVPEAPPEDDLLEYLAFALYKQGNMKLALQYNDRIYAINPHHPRAKGNIKWYEEQLLNEGVKSPDFRRALPKRIFNPRPQGYNDIYHALCRNEVPVSVREISQLYCYYKMDRPFLRLAPIKVEIIHFNPLAVLFRDIISDKEIERIQELAKPKLARATVQNSQTGELEISADRVSNSAWLRSEADEVVHRINQRIHLMTNLDIETAEELQIANYGIGGYYDPHFDFALKEESKIFSEFGTGNRIATVLFYMSHPEEGGATVFTEINSHVPPTKNDALFWYNLYRSGVGDLRTKHAACPVLLGIKWVSNKWIHEHGQEHYRPCAIKPSVQERYVGDLGGPEPRNHPNISPFPKGVVPTFKI